MGLLVVDSVTVLGPEARGAVVVGGSHCGLYAVYLAAAAGVRGVVLNDAGLGRERAGVGGLERFGVLGLACAAYGNETARIGWGRDAIERGVVTVVNEPAAKLGVAVGQSVAEAAGLLGSGPVWDGEVAEVRESRTVVDGVV